MLRKYFQAPHPRGVYELGLHLGDTAKQLDFDHRKMTKRWLESTQPPIPKLVAQTVLGNERQAIFGVG